MNEILELKKLIRDVPDFPKKGIMFKDITPMLENAQGLASSINQMALMCKDLKISKIVAMESRGFIFGVPLAVKLGVGFVPLRKPGKLPYKTIKESYALEYGTDTLEMHEDAISKGEKILIVDDLLATGGTARGAAKLVEKCGGEVIGFLFAIELGFLKGKEKLSNYNVRSMITYE